MTLFESLQKQLVSKMHFSSEKERRLHTVTNTLQTSQHVSQPHRVVQMIMSAYLLDEGYDRVRVEYPLKELLVPEKVRELRVDVIGSKQLSTSKKQVILLEVETGHVPASHYSDQATYRRSRDAAKVSRYFYPYPFFSNENIDRVCGLVVPSFYIVQLPVLYSRPPKQRKEHAIKLEKNVLDRYYNSPPIPLEKVKYARVDYIYEVIPDLLLERSTNTHPWLKKTSAKTYLRQNKSKIMPVDTLVQKPY